MAKSKSRTTRKTASRRPAGARSPRAKAAAKRPVRRKTAAKPAVAPPAPQVWAWHELMTTDVNTCRAFYGQLFGWGTRDMPMGDSTYTIFTKRGQDIGGMMAMRGPKFQGVRPNWMIYVSVDDVDTTAARARKLGGQALVPPTDIPNIGRFAVLQDPTGAVIAVYKSGR